MSTTWFRNVHVQRATASYSSTPKGIDWSIGTGRAGLPKAQKERLQWSIAPRLRPCQVNLLRSRGGTSRDQRTSPADLAPGVACNRRHHDVLAAITLVNGAAAINLRL